MFVAMGKKAKKKQKAKTKSKKASYKVDNWREYNNSLVKRGSLTLWVSDDVIEAWEDKRPAQRGGQYEFSDTAIEALLLLKYTFKLPYRGTEGFAESLFELMNVSLSVPDYSTLCRRNRTLDVNIKMGETRPRAILIDSTGLKVYGEGEWKTRKHGVSKRRTWRKLHICIDEDSQEIVMMQLSGNELDDAQAGVEMLGQMQDAPEMKPERIAGDGGYDKRKFYDACHEAEIDEIVIPPQKNAKIWQHGNCKAPPHSRDENLRAIRKGGRQRWKEESQYHKRSLVETAMYRFKTIFGGELSSRTMESQQVEAALKCKALNRMTAIGMPHSYKLAVG